MKRSDLIKTIEGFGCVFVRHGGKYDWYRNSPSNPKAAAANPAAVASSTRLPIWCICALLRAIILLPRATSQQTV